MIQRLASCVFSFLLLPGSLLAVPVETPEFEPLRNTIRWTTASEVDNFGFDLFRSESGEGPFARINERPVPGAGTTDLPTDYVYVDDSIESDTVYFYYVESISMHGERERATPLIRAPAKSRPK